MALTRSSLMKLMELWRWRYRDAQTGQICRTPFQMTAAQAVQFAEAERIPGSMRLVRVEDDFVDTAPDVFNPPAHA
jgi:hypothetical protein